jgi:hypothetical protein
MLSRAYRFGVHGEFEIQKAMWLGWCREIVMGLRTRNGIGNCILNQVAFFFNESKGAALHTGHFDE